MTSFCFFFRRKRRRKNKLNDLNLIYCVTSVIIPFLLINILFSCKGPEPVTPFVAPDCVQTIIGNLQENDSNPDCFASVKRYSFEGGEVFEVQTDACLDGPINIIDDVCDTICTLTFQGFNVNSSCGASSDFYDDAVLIDVLFEEMN